MTMLLRVDTGFEASFLTGWRLIIFDMMILHLHSCPPGKLEIDGSSFDNLSGWIEGLRFDCLGFDGLKAYFSMLRFPR